MNEKGFPDAAPIYFIVKYTFDIYFVTPALSQKMGNMLRCDDVVLTVTNESTTETVHIRGKATEEQTMLKEVFSELAKKLDYSEGFVQKLPVF